MELTNWFSFDGFQKYKTKSVFPKNLVHGGLEVDGHPIYVARTNHEGNVLPGYSYKGVGYFVFEKDVVVKPLDKCDLLYGDNIKFKSRNEVSFFHPHTTFVQAGHTVLREPLFVGSFSINGTFYCGQLMRNGVCAIAYDGLVYLNDTPPYILTFNWPTTAIIK
ncbi:uncharacterized protein LOC135936465 [Cloeon dipterum]|uniref:uncharacterized protein LOC135936465 n=1 Tax=Cloeon dipterum TaxID=197152 RepID=UPI00321FDE1D